MQIHVKKRIYHDKLGRLEPGAVVEMQDKQAQNYIAQGAAETYLTKVVREDPFQDSGTITPDLPEKTKAKRTKKQ